MSTLKSVFRCGHPKTPENSTPVGKGYATCSFCRRVKYMCLSAERAQARINAGGYTVGERV